MSSNSLDMVIRCGESWPIVLAQCFGDRRRAALVRHCSRCEALDQHFPGRHAPTAGWDGFQLGMQQHASERKLALKDFPGTDLYGTDSRGWLVARNL